MPTSKISSCIIGTSLTMSSMEDFDLDTAHPALEVFVVLKRVFQYFSDSELRLIRLVNRFWNFTAMSELVFRQYLPPPVKIGDASSDQLYAHNYLDFENQRRRMWTDLYGPDCSILEFRNLQLHFPFGDETLHKILRQPWLSSVSSLTLSTLKISDRTEPLINWILAALPNLLEFNCFVTSEGNLVHDLEKLNVTEVSSENLNSPAAPTQLRKNPNLKKALVRSCCVEEAYSFPWYFFNDCSDLQNLELRFGDAASLLRGAESLKSASSTRTVRNLRITLKRAPVFEEQVQEEDLNTETFAAANAKLCNHFLPQSSLSIDSLIPAAYIFVFLKFLDPAPVTKLNLNLTAPYDNEPDHHEMRTTFTTFLVPEISLKFWNLKDLELKFLQYETEVPFVIPATETLTMHQNVLRNPENLTIRTHPLHDASEPGPWYKVPDYGLKILENSGFHLITHLFFEVGQDWDIMIILQTAASHSIRVKKLVLRGSADANSNGCQLFTCACALFPDVCPPAPDEWYRGRLINESTFQGLQGVESLEELTLERIVVSFQPKVFEVIHKTARLKSIRLDAAFIKNFTDRNARLHSSSTWDWPSQIGCVSVIAI